MATEAGTFATYPSDEGLDVNNLPDAPWTPKSLGEELFAKLARVCGAGALTNNMGASLDPRSFGMGRAARLIALNGLADDPDPLNENSEDHIEWQRRVRALLTEGESLQSAINAKLPDQSGTRRDEKAPPLEGITMTLRKREY